MWVGGVRKWQFLMIYSTVNHQRGGRVGLKKSKTWWRNTWMVPKREMSSLSKNCLRETTLASWPSPNSERKKKKKLTLYLGIYFQGKYRVSHYICLCLIHVVTFTLISILVTDYIQKRRGQALLFSFEYNLLPNLTLNFNTTYYMDRALGSNFVAFTRT